MTTSDSFLFVSHVSEDRAAAMEIVAELERRGLRCWIAPRDVRPGTPFDDEIADAIDASLAMLLIFSERCNESEYIRREVTVAGESHKVIIPFRIEDAPPRRGLRVRLADLHWVDGFVSREQAIDDLLRTFKPTDGLGERVVRHKAARTPDKAGAPEEHPDIDKHPRRPLTDGETQGAKARRIRNDIEAASRAEEIERHRAIPRSKQHTLPRLWVSAAAVVGLLLGVALLGFLLAERSPPTSPDPRSDTGAEAVNVRADVAAIDLIPAVNLQRSAGDRIIASTAPGPDGIIRRFEVRAREGGRGWAIFALANSGDEPLDRLLVAPHYRTAGSGVIAPVLDQSHIVNITPSLDEPPARRDNASADVFQIRLKPGEVVTYVAELRRANLPQLELWEPDSYKDRTNGLLLYQSVVIGIAGLLALFLTLLCVFERNLTFLTAALLGWAVLVYVGIDFGLWNLLFNISAGTVRTWRASAEAGLVTALLLFLFAYPDVNRRLVGYPHIAIACLAFLGVMLAIAMVSPAIVSGISRILLPIVAVLGLSLVAYRWMQGEEHPNALIPSWLFLVLWTFGATLTWSGWLGGENGGPALTGALVLFVMLVGVPVTKSLWR